MQKAQLSMSSEASLAVTNDMLRVRLVHRQEGNLYFWLIWLVAVRVRLFARCGGRMALVGSVALREGSRKNGLSSARSGCNLSGF